MFFQFLFAKTFFLFEAVFNEVYKETIGQMDFRLLRDRPILGPRISVAGRSNAFGNDTARKTKKKQNRKTETKKKKTEK